MKYTHNGDDSINDGFAFVVQDGTGGFWLRNGRQYKD
ncbi:MAG: hypothetical protein IPJ74_24275 [Saprospiraceae bacterium]|nr:hypothetical protein [Saprospiraceae bacterium]